MKLGSRWKSRVCDAQVIIVKPPAAAGRLECGGAPMVPFDAVVDAHAAEPGSAAAALLGKRYFDEVSGIELLCTRAGAGPLTFDGRALSVKQAKRLPSSD